MSINNKNYILFNELTTKKHVKDNLIFQSKLFSIIKSAHDTIPGHLIVLKFLLDFIDVTNDIFFGIMMCKRITYKIKL